MLRKAVHNPDSTWHIPVARALCASGGGSRALSYTMGVYRGLNEAWKTADFLNVLIRDSPKSPSNMGLDMIDWDI